MAAKHFFVSWRRQLGCKEQTLVKRQQVLVLRPQVTGMQNNVRTVSRFLPTIVVGNGYIPDLVPESGSEVTNSSTFATRSQRTKIRPGSGPRLLVLLYYEQLLSIAVHVTRKRT
jgi:hypothetical protein